MTYRITAYVARPQIGGWRQTAVRGIADDRADGPDTALLLAAQEIADHNKKVRLESRIQYDALVCESDASSTPNTEGEIEFLAKYCPQEMQA